MFDKPCQQLPVRRDPAGGKQIPHERRSLFGQMRQRERAVLKAAHGSGYRDSGDFLQMFAAIVRLSHGSEECSEIVEYAFFFFEAQGIADPGPGMLLYRIA